MRQQRIRLYLVIAFVWTWTGWIAGSLLARSRGLTIQTDDTIFSLFTGNPGDPQFLPQLIFTIAVYGPLVGFLAVVGWKLAAPIQKRVSGSGLFWLLVLLVPIAVVLPTALVSLLMGLLDTGGRTAPAVFAAIGVYFLSNLFTSGTEEFGWRGFLYPAMKRAGGTFWDIAWKGGLIWAVWHFPLLVQMYLPLGPAVLIPSLVGFSASIVAMNYITNLLYERTGNVLAAVLLHALNNTLSFAVMLLFPGTPVTILIHLSAWAVVWLLEKKGLEKTAS
jgi:membrane protease YdiL (CAAX protease family)